MSKADHISSKAAARFRRTGARSIHAARTWVDTMTQATGDYVDLAGEALEGSISLSQFARGAVALWIETGSSACGWYHDLWTSCLTGKAPGDGGATVYFEIDVASHCTDSLPLGNVRWADRDDLQASDLLQVPDGNRTLKGKVEISRVDAIREVFVQLVDLADVDRSVGDCFMGKITRKSNGAPVAIVVVNVVEEITQ